MPGISILIVEDEAMTAIYMETMLKRNGFNVLGRVSSGEAAVAFAIKNTPDLIVMDIRLAGKMDGIEAAEKIIENLHDSVQFIFTTGYSDRELKDRALRIKPLAFLVKPVSLQDILKAIELFPEPEKQ